MPALRAWVVSQLEKERNLPPAILTSPPCPVRLGQETTSQDAVVCREWLDSMDPS